MAQAPSLSANNSGNSKTRPLSATNHVQKSPSKSTFSLTALDDGGQTKDEYEAEIKSLQRDKQVLQAKLDKVETAQNKQSKKIR